MDDVDRDMNIVGPRTRWMDDVDRDMNIVGLRTRWMDDVDRDICGRYGQRHEHRGP